MKFVFDGRPAYSPFVESYWRTQSIGGGSFTSVAESHWGIVVTKQEGKLWLTVRGPETKASPAPIPEDADFFGIVFKLGSYMPKLPSGGLVNGAIDLPEATRSKFWFNGSAWEFPKYENADIFVDRLVREGLLVTDPVVETALKEQPQDVSIRTVRRRFLAATGLTHGAIQQIERAKLALNLLQRGVSILDTVEQAGYSDQPHLTKSLKHFVGQTPAQILRTNEPG